MTQGDVIFFRSDKRIGAIQPDGAGECHLEFPIPNQACWQMGMGLRDGRMAVLWSQEPPRNPSADFEAKDGLKYAKTHMWLYDFAEGIPREIFMGPVGELPGSGRLLGSRNVDNVTDLFTCDLDGGGRETIYTGPGLAYGTTLSPDGAKAAFHIVGVPGKASYEIYVIELATRKCILIASDPEYLNFGPAWSPDSRWVLYQRCAYRRDPGHERADICISRADGAEHRLLTTGQRHWFGTSYGPAENHGDGSSLPAWSPDGRWITFTRCLPDSQTAWVYRPDRPDTDHFNRDHRPDLARGGTEICLIDPNTGEITPITHYDPPTWNFRCVWSPDSSRLAFARADVGCVPGLWVMDVDGGNQRLLTRGLHDRGADHYQWLRLSVPPHCLLRRP